MGLSRHPGDHIKQRVTDAVEMETVGFTKHNTTSITGVRQFAPRQHSASGVYTSPESRKRRSQRSAALDQSEAHW